MPSIFKSLPLPFCQPGGISQAARPSGRLIVLVGVAVAGHYEKTSPAWGTFCLIEFRSLTLFFILCSFLLSHFSAPAVKGALHI